MKKRPNKERRDPHIKYVIEESIHTPYPTSQVDTGWIRDSKTKFFRRTTRKGTDWLIFDATDSHTARSIDEWKAFVRFGKERREFNDDTKADFEKWGRVFGSSIKLFRKEKAKPTHKK